MEEFIRKEILDIIEFYNNKEEEGEEKEICIHTREKFLELIKQKEYIKACIHSPHLFTDSYQIFKDEFDINTQDSDSRKTVLHIMCGSHCIDTVKEFINKIDTNNNIDVNIKDNEGNIPLVYSCKTFYSDEVKILIDVGSYVWTKNNEGKYPIEYLIGKTYNPHDRLGKERILNILIPVYLKRMWQVIQIQRIYRNHHLAKPWHPYRRRQMQKGIEEYLNNVNLLSS